MEEILVRKNITKQQLSQETGISYPMICFFVKGKADMTSKKLYKIAKFLNVRMEDLVEVEED